MILKLFFILLSVMCTAYFASGETALTSLEPLDLKKMLKQKRKNAWAFSVWLEKPNRILATFLVGNNLTVVIASVLMVTLSHDFSIMKGFSPAAVMAVSGIMLTFFILLFGEILPKVYARNNKEKVSEKIIESVVFLSIMLTPVVKVLLFISNNITRLFSGSAQAEVPFFTDSEIERMLKIGETEGALKKREREIITSILEFDELRVQDIMTTRSMVFSVNADEPGEAVFKKIIAAGYSRIPAYRGQPDNIVGIIYAKDIVNAFRNTDLILIQDLLRTAYFIPETKKVRELLAEFRQGKHMALAVNEYGEFVGIITIEDIIEEIVGDIQDEYDIDETGIVNISEKEWLVPGAASLEEICLKLEIKLESEYFDTVGGYVMDLFGRIPKSGEKIQQKGVLFSVEQAEKRKILKLRITLKQ